MAPSSSSSSPGDRPRGLPYALLLAAVWGALVWWGCVAVQSMRLRSAPPTPRAALPGAWIGLTLALLCHVGPLRRRRRGEPEREPIVEHAYWGRPTDAPDDDEDRSLQVRLTMWAAGWVVRGLYAVLAWPGIRGAEALGLYHRP